MGTFKIGKVIWKSLFRKPATLMYPVVPREWTERTRGSIDINGSNCIACGICEKKCPTNAITVSKENGYWEIQRMQCIQCGCCVEACPKTCLTMNPKYTEPGTTKVIDKFDIPSGSAKKAAPAAKDASAAKDAPAESGLNCNLDECVLCGACTDECPVSAITVDDTWSVNKDTCIECGVCVDTCPTGCLALAGADGEDDAADESIEERVGHGMDGRRITIRPFYEGEFANPEPWKKGKAPEETDLPAEPPVITDDTKSNGEADQGLVCHIDDCIFCGICVKECPIESLSVDRKRKVWVVDRDKCSQCSACVDKCPKKCLEMK